MKSSESTVNRPTPPDNSAAPLAGLHLHGYEYVRKLSEGGMGAVHLARHRITNRLDVLKVVGKALLRTSGAAERFRQEIRSAALLRHDNVVAAYTAFELGDGSLAFAMEYVDGHDLGELVRRHGPLPVANACYYAVQAARGLQHAHERRAVHRDIKPGNLMLTKRDGKSRVMVLDFGLAKATSEKAVDGGQTAAGMMMGTPFYMAPEQADDAASADIRADIYSLGCTLHHLLAGGPPFAGTMYDLLRKHRDEPPPRLDAVRPDVPPALAAVAARMMAKAPADRFQTPKEAAEALAPFFRGKSQEAAGNVEPLPIPTTAASRSRSEAPTATVWKTAPAADRHQPEEPAGPAARGARSRPGRTLAVAVSAAAFLVVVAVVAALFVFGPSDKPKAKSNPPELVVKPEEPKPAPTDQDRAFARIDALAARAAAGGAGLAELADFLKDDDLKVRRKAAAAIAKLKGDTSAAADRLDDATTDRDPEVQKFAWAALVALDQFLLEAVAGNLAVAADPAGAAAKRRQAVLYLAGRLGLKNRNPEVRLKAAEALADPAVDVAPVVEVLRAAQDDIAPKVQEVVKEALAKYDRLKKDQDEGERRRLDEAEKERLAQAEKAHQARIDQIRQLGLAANDPFAGLTTRTYAINQLIRILRKDPDLAYRLEAAAHLLGIAADLVEAQNALREALNDANERDDVRRAAKAAYEASVKRIGTEEDRALTERLKTADDKITITILVQLAARGKAAFYALPAVCEVALVPRMRQQALECYAKIDPECGALLVLVLVEIRDGLDIRKRHDAIAALGKIGVRAAGVVPALRWIYRNSLESTAKGGPVYVALNTLLLVAPGDVFAVGHILNMVAERFDPDNNARTLLVNEMRKIALQYFDLVMAVDAKRLVEALGRAVYDPACRAAAAERLGRLGTAAKPALPTLKNFLLLDNRTEVKAALAAAVKAIEAAP